RTGAARRCGRAGGWGSAGARRSCPARDCGPRAGEEVPLGERCPADAVGVPGGAVMSGSQVGAVVVTHGPHEDLADCLSSLDRQVDQLVVVANLPGRLPVPSGAALIENTKPLGFAENVNRGLAATTAPWVVMANPDTVAR